MKRSNLCSYYIRLLLFGPIYAQKVQIDYEGVNSKIVIAARPSLPFIASGLILNGV